MNMNRWLDIMDGGFVVLLVLCACGITKALSITGYTKWCIIGLCCGAMCFYLSGYLPIVAYWIKKKLIKGHVI